MFLLHPKVAQLVNTRSIHTPFVSDGLDGSVEGVLYAQQSNRLLAMGHQSLASSGGTASISGGAAGPGGGPAGAGGGAFSGTAAVAAGGGNGACGGVPVGGQEIGRYFFDGTTTRVSQYYIDDVEPVEPLTAPGFGGGMLLRSSGPGSTGAGAAGALVGGIGSVMGAGTNGMVYLGNYPGKDVPPQLGGPTCNSNKNTKK